MTASRTRRAEPGVVMVRSSATTIASTAARRRTSVPLPDDVVGQQGAEHARGEQHLQRPAERCVERAAGRPR